MDRKEREILEKEYENAVKPVTLHGPNFVDVIKALLETKPMPKEDRDKNEGKS